ncbi:MULTISPECIES: N-acetylmuramoyl-L-alanine amidase [Actinomycetes]|uniref:N-acetylmuramoyl-L-alanine amidase n=1 Tax=Amycolatopsis echigonensis TaxID=2576905 RepID=A0A2N3WGK4_9PSEU|nr:MULTISPECIES: N-acetylmuramoyl-L-alanine amidase [Actinomycetes]ATY15753.1 N-acetylmuramoyl-L-alanine amidase [Amycolatopsis sp. AA4]EFL12057.1 N-acetylmuramoyl-L-alanine amidase [Streptomyces sp. AA4]MBB2498075.1 N-acetylmuramoyl-L-alanine amidase [Amycolatopsis echigonensis]PKV93000.1 N-acetylmuramoyl-L-alanine amidase [Amycolatopsis niigatensis]
MRVLRRGDAGPDVAEIRSILAGMDLLPPVAGTERYNTFDVAVEQAVRAFQQRRGLITDGVVGPATYQALKGASYHLGSRPLQYLLSSPVHGDDVFTLQERLTELGFDAGRPDGYFGPQTERALRTFQRDMRLTSDGICGPATIRELHRLSSPRARGGRPVFLREQEQVRQAGPRLRGKRIVIDPGHGGEDLGVVAGGLREADIAWDLARRLEGRMQATGMEALISRGPNHSPTDFERARFANDAGADLFLSLHSDGNPSPRAQGVASFHFGTGNGTTSTVGELLAGFIQREVAARTGLLDCRTHYKTWEIFTRTRCPAVRVEIGYLTNPDDAARLADPAFRDVVAEGILIAVKRLYLLGEGDQPTGTFTFADVLAHELAKAE